MALNNLGLGFVLTAKDSASAVLQQAGKALGKLKTDTEKMRDRVAAAGQEMQGIGKVMMGIGGAGLAGLGVAAKASGDFELAVAKVQTIADKAIFPLGMIRDTGFDMSQAYGGTLTQQMDALYSAIGSGASTAADATSVLHSANQLAIGGISSVDKTMTLLMGTMNAYGTGLEDAQKTADSFFQSVKLGGSDMSVESLVASLSGVTPIASAMGVSLDQVLGSLARMTAVGIPTAQAVTGIKAAIEGIIKPTPKAIAEAKRLGIAFDGAALRAKGLPGIIESITSSAKFNTKSFQLMFESVDGLSAALALGADGSKPYLEMMKEMGEASGATKEAFETLGKTGNVTATQLMSKVGVALVKIGDVVAPLGGKLVKFAATVVDAFNNLPAPVITALTLAFAIASAFTFLAGVAVFLGGAVAALATVGEAIIGAFLAMAVVTSGVGVAILAAAAAFYVFRAAYEQNLGRFASVIQGLYAQGKLAVDGLKQLFTDGGFSGSVRTEMAKAENSGIKQFAIQLFMWASRIGNFLDGIKQTVSAGFSQMGGTFNQLSMSFLKLIGLFGLGQDSAEVAAGSFDRFGEAGGSVGRVIVKALDLVIGAITQVIQFTTGLVQGFQSVMPGGAHLKALGESLSNIWAIFGSILTSVGISAGGTKGGMAGLGQVLGFLIGLLAQAIAFVINFGAAFAGPVMAGISAVVGIVMSLGSILTGVWDVIAGLFTADWPRLWLGLGKVVYGVIGVIVNLVMMMVSQIAAGLDMLSRMGGKKDSGFQKAVEATKVDMMKGIGEGLGLKGPEYVTPTPAEGAPGAPGAPGGAPGKDMPLPAAEIAKQKAANAEWAKGTPAFDPKVIGPMPAPPPVNTTTNITLNIDGEKIADIVEKHQHAAGDRSFGPRAAAT